MAVPTPRVPISIRTATMADVPFVDELHKKNGKGLGFFPRKQFEDYIGGGHVLVAEEVGSSELVVGSEDAGSLLPTTNYQLPTPLGYVIAKDRYLKRDELGVVYQLCVVGSIQRKLVGAALLKAVFDRSAYGCRLYCCWCAQDLAANYFWEAMGFVPLAFRAGSDRKRRVHIFWQKRIVEGDETPWWYPFKTDQGALRADRVVFPVPPGVHWSEVRGVEVPQERHCELKIDNCQLAIGNRKTSAPPKKRPDGPGPGKVGILVGGRIKYVDRPGYVAPLSPLPPVTPSPLLLAPKRERKPAAKIDPAFLAKARELRDRYLEHVNGGGGRHQLESRAVYRIARAPDPGASVRLLAG